jgi:ribosomal protein S18 acetylase RimI-like enzyme
MVDVVIRRIRPDDNIVMVTDIIHRAYAELSAMGLRFWATYQSVADTQQRFSEGYGYVAVVDGMVVGTITIYPPDANNSVPAYREESHYGIGQFAVDPDFRGRGIGRLLHDTAVDVVRSMGGTAIVLDTADAAAALIDLYHRWGYSIVDHADWRPVTNYTSVVMKKDISC